VITTTGGSTRRARIIGLGNVLLGDDGFGPLAVEMFRCQYECGSNVDVLDLGTPGLDLAPYLYGTDLVVIADAVHAEDKSGTLCMYSEADLLTRRTRRAWRGIGEIPSSGLRLREAYCRFDAESRLAVEIGHVEESNECVAGLVLQGLRKPHECTAFGTRCTPDTPLGAPMVSSEGACAAYFHFGRRKEDGNPIVPSATAGH